MLWQNTGLLGSCIAIQIQNYITIAVLTQCHVIPLILLERTDNQVTLLGKSLFISRLVYHIGRSITEFQLSVLQKNGPTSGVSLNVNRTVSQNDTVVLRLYPKVNREIIIEIIYISQINTSTSIRIEGLSCLWSINRSSHVLLARSIRNHKLGRSGTYIR